MKIAFSPQGKLVATLLLTAVSILLVMGWNAGAAQPAQPQRPFLPLSMSINELMVAVIDHAAHPIWDGGNSKVPLTERQWKSIEEHTFQLEAGATLVSLGGTGKADPGWTASPAFQEQARKLRDAAVASRKAVKAKDQKALFTAGTTLAAVCENCHSQFKPDVPTEGILHDPYYKD